MNVYGRTKLMGEQILRDLEASDPAWNIAWLRYFNPVGAHESGRMGEDPRGVPNNLMPYVAAGGRGPARVPVGLSVADYDTPDGTGVRDYLHVMDLAEGHVAAVRYLLGQQKIGASLSTWAPAWATACWTWCNAFERACGRQTHPLPASWTAALATCPAYYADATLAQGSCWAGKRSAAWTKCAPTAGAGNRARTRRATAADRRVS